MWVDFLLEGQNEKVHTFCLARKGSYYAGFVLALMFKTNNTREGVLQSIYLKAFHTY
jgi:hypothetical protein